MALTSKINSTLTLSAVITRADGTVEDLGIISTSKKKTILNKIMDYIKNIRLGG